jgi:hypothetical protein
LAASAEAVTRADRRLGMENVVCIYIGEKISGGFHTGQWAVKVQVLRKSGNPDRISSSAFISPYVAAGGKTFPTDIEQVPFPASAYQVPGIYGYQERPALCGDSIGRNDAEGATGTLSCLVIVNNTLYLMSNNHVLAAVNGGTEGVDEILQPGLADAGSVANTYSIATLSKFVPLNLTSFDGGSVTPSLADVALGWTNPADASYRHHNFTINKDAMRYSGGNMVVKKEGRTTGFSVGRIIGFNADVPVGYGPPAFPGGPPTAPFAHFSNQLVIRSDDSSNPFSQGGDSGSLIVEYGSNCPVALLVAGNGNDTYANPIEDVLNALENTGWPVDKFVTSDDDLN